MLPALIFAVAGVTAMELSVGDAGVLAFTVMEAVPLTPFCVPVMVVEPAATAVTRPLVLTVAMAELALAHVACELMSAVEESLYVAVAENCCVPPTVRLADAGESPIVLRVLAGVGDGGAALLEPQPERAVASVAATTAMQRVNIDRPRRSIEPSGVSGAQFFIRKRCQGLGLLKRKRRRGLLWRPPRNIRSIAARGNHDCSQSASSRHPHGTPFVCRGDTC